MPKTILRVRIVDLSFVQESSEEAVQSALASQDASTYETEVPPDLDDRLYDLIAYGLLFENDWTIQDTTSRWEIEREVPLTDLAKK
jgi:hypothetical protein